MAYDRDRVATYFDTDPAFEWDRLSADVNGRIRYAIHRRYLEESIAKVGSPSAPTVLDVGAGPGRFAIDAIRLGARVTVTDISQRQLDEAKHRITEAGLSHGVEEYAVADVLDLSSFPDDWFDVVLCFGGAVSYVRDEHPQALAELLRVARSRVVLSVMSLRGALRLIGPLDAAEVLEQPDALLSWQAVLDGDGVVYSKDSPSQWHLPIALFTSAGLAEAIEKEGGAVLQLATANPLVVERLKIPNIESNEVAEANITTLEVALSSVPGLVDAGEHLIAIAEPSATAV